MKTLLQRILLVVLMLVVFTVTVVVTICFWEAHQRYVPPRLVLSFLLWGRCW